jgi:hypothetical protein
VRRASGREGGALEAAEGRAEGRLSALEHGDLAGGPQAVGAKSRDEQEGGGEAGEAAEDPGRARG